MLNQIKELYNFRELLKNLVIKELKLRYKKSVLGFLWTMLVLERELAKKFVAFTRAVGKVCLLGDFPTGSPELGINDRHIIGLMDELISIKSVVKSKNGIDWLFKKNKYLKSHITFIDREFQMYQQHKVIDGKDFY